MRALHAKGGGYRVRAATLAEGEGVALQKRERRHADHPEQIAHEARSRARVQRVVQVCVQRLPHVEADACGDGEDQDKLSTRFTRMLVT